MLTDYGNSFSFFKVSFFSILKGVLQDFLTKILGWVKEMKSTGLFVEPRSQQVTKEELIPPSKFWV